MSARLSPDGMYYWDGVRWVTTLSSDGGHRWDGSAWVPAASTADSRGFQPGRTLTRVPTSWTRPLQLAVAGWYVWSALYALVLPLWMSGPLSQYMTESMNQSFQRQSQLDPSMSPPPPELISSLTSMTSAMVTFSLWFGVIFSLAMSAVAIVGALRRWTWLYYVVLVLLGLTVVTLPLDLLNLATGRALSSGFGVGMSIPSWVVWVGTITSLPGVALFALMLIAVIKRGPWGMAKAGP